MIVTKTPLRISFFGGGSDLPSFYKKNKYGAIISSSINKYLYVTLKKQNSLFDEKYRLNYATTELVNNINEIKNPIIKECFKFMNIDEHLYISTIADAPAATGLGSSSAFCVGLLNALYKYKNIPISKEELAKRAADIEINNLGLSLGKQDHYSATYGGLNFIKFYDNDTVEIKNINTKSKKFLEFQKNILIFWTGVQRSAETILKEQSINNDDNTNGLKILRRYAEEFYYTLTGQNNENFDINYFYKKFNKSWEIKKSFSKNITNSSIDKAYNLALKNGALGGKICGAGGGGFLLLLADQRFHNKISKELTKLDYEKYNLNFSNEGSKVYEIE